MAYINYSMLQRPESDFREVCERGAGSVVVGRPSMYVSSGYQYPDRGGQGSFDFGGSGGGGGGRSRGMAPTFRPIAPPKINLDDLYERSRLRNLRTLDLYNRIIYLVQRKITQTAQQRFDNTMCWHRIPEIILGCAMFDHAKCVAHVMHHLQESGYRVNFVAPDWLFIYWGHWVPSDVRREIKKNTGIEVDSFGNEIRADPAEEEEDEEEADEFDAQIRRGPNGTRYPPAPIETSVRGAEALRGSLMDPNSGPKSAESRTVHIQTSSSSATRRGGEKGQAATSAPPSDAESGGGHSEGREKRRSKREYTPIQAYRPSGNMVYDDDLLQKALEKVHAPANS